MNSPHLSCWIIVNGYLQHTKFSDLALFIKEAAVRKGLSADIIRNSSLMPMIEDGRPVLRGSFTRLPDLVVFMDKDIALAKHLEMMGLPVFNKSSVIETCDSKAKTHQALAACGIPMPKTIFPPFTYEGVGRTDLHLFTKIGQTLGYPLVVKEAYGSFGQQVYLIHSEQELQERVMELAHKPFILQEFIDTSFGKDIRINVVGDQAAAAMKRTSANDFRANMTAGGKAEPYTPTQEEEELAIRSAQILGADFAGVDLLFGKNGPLLCEVNSNSHLLHLYECTGINVADKMFDYIVKEFRR
ncbi:ATP-grasp domain-containing protein [Bacillus massiliglaciei]|uniref:ATP-grasp domain-containing protein n=1 Tax=Bacillus massiliglaciei TaxID=1816693 RepID=UPI000B2D1DE7|nr:RimK family alpha-L-glutamate ligase [Bacillus massiliglaciei]